MAAAPFRPGRDARHPSSLPFREKAGGKSPPVLIRLEAGPATPSLLQKSPHTADFFAFRDVPGSWPPVRKEPLTQCGRMGIPPFLPPLRRNRAFAPRPHRLFQKVGQKLLRRVPLGYDFFDNLKKPAHRGLFRFSAVAPGKQPGGYAFFLRRPLWPAFSPAASRAWYVFTLSSPAGSHVLATAQRPSPSREKPSRTQNAPCSSQFRTEI